MEKCKLENFLKNYNKITVQLTDIDLTINAIKENIPTKSLFICYRNPFLPEESIDLISENSISQEEKITLLEKRKNQLNFLLKRLDNVLAFLPDFERRIIDMKYKKRMSFNDIATICGNSFTTCAHIAKRSIQMMADVLYDDLEYTDVWKV